MTSLIANIVLNAFMAILLLLTIGYCWVLNKRIKVLQDSKSELAQLLKHFDQSTQRASESIIALQTASKKIGENIQMRIEKANYLVDDLAFMIEKGDKITSQIEAGFAVQRARTRIATQAHAPEPEEMPEPVHHHEETPAVERTQSSREKTVSSLEAVLERVVSRKGAKPPKAEESPAAASQAAPPLPARSRSEQELLDMLKAGLKG